MVTANSLLAVKLDTFCYVQNIVNNSLDNNQPYKVMLWLIAIKVVGCVVDCREL